jgi:sugar phosphate isomerase/epimerase
MGDLTIGINLPGSCSTPKSLTEGLRRITDDGYEVAEVGLDTFPLIIEGEVNDRYVSWLKEQLGSMPLRYSAHIDGKVNLRSLDNYQLNRQVLYCSIDICAALGMSPLVLHFELESESLEIEERFYSDHRKAADYAEGKGVLLCMENIEVEKVEPVVRMVESLDHPNFRMCLDAGHAFLAADYFQFDYLEAVKSAAEFIGHVHMSGNTGVFEPLRITDRPSYDSLSKNYRFAFGRGDIHAPPLWGSIPYDEVFALLRDTDCIFLCEYYSERFLPFSRSIQEEVRGRIQEARLSSR